MSNPVTLVPFVKGHDPRRNETGKNKNSKWLTTLIEDFLRSEGKDGETFDKKFTRAGVLRAVAKSDTLWNSIMERIDGKIVTPIDLHAELRIEQLRNLEKKLLNIANDENTEDGTTDVPER